MAPDPERARLRPGRRAALSSAPVPPIGGEDHLRGPAQAPLVIAYLDYSCPRCALAHARLSEVPVRLAVRSFALRVRDPRALPAARAAEAAGLQGAFWPMHDALFSRPGRLEDPDLWAYAAALGLDGPRFDADRRGEEVLARVEEQVRGALRAGVAVTPTLVVAGELHPGPPDAGWLASLGR